MSSDEEVADALTGAQSMVHTLADSGIEICFANPGTSEMHFVGALDRTPRVRGVLCLFEGVATGAADGWGRMTGRPAATLLHLGPGLANGLANLHNARRAHTPLVNVIGDHATHHKHLDPPLESDLDALAATVSSWVHRPASVAEAGLDAAAAVAASMSPAAAAQQPIDPRRTGTSGSVATLLVPADVSWSPGGRTATPVPNVPQRTVSEEVLGQVQAALCSGESCALLLDGAALSEDGLLAASRIATATGARLFAPTWPARLRRGAGVPAVEPLSYRSEGVAVQLDGVGHLVLAGAREPVTPFAYPGRSSILTPDSARVHRLAEDPGADVLTALLQLADRVAAGVLPVLARPVQQALPAGPLTDITWAQVVGALLPAEAIVCDESITAGMASLPAATAGAAPHDALGLVGLAIGQGLPLATGAATACPDRPVICLEADGSAMYTITALWTQAREQLDITTVVLNNRSYAILRSELERVGASADSSTAARLLELSPPDLDFVALATGMGVPATRATTAEELAEQFTAALAAPGPHLIDAILVPNG